MSWSAMLWHKIYAMTLTFNVRSNACSQDAILFLYLDFNSSNSVKFRLFIPTVYVVIILLCAL